MNKQLEAELEERFAPHIQRPITVAGMSSLYNAADELRDFCERIHTEARKELIAEIEGMKVEVTDCQHTPSDSCDNKCSSKEWDFAHNSALDKAITHLRDEGRE